MSRLSYGPPTYSRYKGVAPTKAKCWELFFFYCILVLHYSSSSVFRFALVASKYLFIVEEYQILLWFSVNCPLGGAS